MEIYILRKISRYLHYLTVSIMLGIYEHKIMNCISTYVLFYEILQCILNHMTMFQITQQYSGFCWCEDYKTCLVFLRFLQTQFKILMSNLNTRYYSSLLKLFSEFGVAFSDGISLAGWLAVLPVISMDAISLLYLAILKMSYILFQKKGIFLSFSNFNTLV